MVDVTLNVNYTPVIVTSDGKQHHNKKLMKKTKHSNNPCCRSPCVLVILALVALSTGISSILVWKTGFMDQVISRKLVIANDTKVFDMWVRPPVQPLTGIYLFNYTNVEAFNKGLEKLRLEELGPFVYRQTMEKVNVEFFDNDTVGFQQHRNYEFVPELSKGSLDDYIMAPNLALLSAVSQAHDSNIFFKISLAGVISGLGSMPFQPLRIGDFLWGYEDVLFNMGTFLKNDLPFDRLGIMAGKNGTDLNRLAVFTGETDLSLLGVVAELNGQTQQTVWDGPECNRIDGSEGGMFPPPLVQEKKDLHIYSHELCRRLPLTFQKSVVRETLPAMRFTPSEDIFSQDNPNTTCYCPKNKCPPKGVFDASPCVYGGPAMISFPHFYKADPELLKQVDGLSPSKDKHEFYLDVHEKFGVILGGQSRIQLNLLVRPSKSFPCMAPFTEETILPVSWFEVGVDDLPDSVTDDLKLATHTASHGLLYSLLTCFVVCSSILAYQVTRRTRASTATPSLYVKAPMLVVPKDRDLVLNSATPADHLCKI